METRRISLEMIEVAKPCEADWDAMTGDHRSRFCGHCRKNVYDLSALTHDEAERLVCEAVGSLCVRFLRAADGAVVTLDYRPERQYSRGWRFWTAVGAVGGLFVAAVDATVLGRGWPSTRVQGGACVMGVMPRYSTTMPTTASVPATPDGTDAGDASVGDESPGDGSRTVKSPSENSRAK